MDVANIALGGCCFRRLGPEAMADQEGPRADYGQDYYEEFQRRAATGIGRELHRFRRRYVELVAPAEGLILDYGCGYGELIASDETGRWRGYDINQRVAERLGDRFDPQPDLSRYAAVCLFDVLEHLTRPWPWLATMTSGSRLVIAVPCWERWDRLEDLPSWRHFKPGEHLIYASLSGWSQLLQDAGFLELDRNRLETTLGRSAVGMLCLERI